jgi:pimeloyl-ACP methyl ester carboxylesterase
MEQARYQFNHDAPVRRETLTIPIAGFDVVVDRYVGGAKQQILLLHGLGGNRVTWKAVAPQMAKIWSATVWAIDWPGFGSTRTSGRRVNLSVLESVTERFMVEQGQVAQAHLPWTVCGNSLGGFLALRVAASGAPVERVVLANTALPLHWGQSERLGRGSAVGAEGAQTSPGRASPSVLALRLRVLSSSLGPLLGRPTPLQALSRFVPLGIPWLGRRLMERYVRTRGVPGVVDDPIGLLFADPSRLAPDLRQELISLSEERLEWSWEAARALEQTTLDAGFALLATDRAERIIRSVRVPVISIYGAADPLFSLAAWEKLRQLRPEWRHRALPDVGHVPQLEAPDEFLRELEDCWPAEVPATTSKTTAERIAPSDPLVPG